MGWIAELIIGIIALIGAIYLTIESNNARYIIFMYAGYHLGRAMYLLDCKRKENKK